MSERFLDLRDIGIMIEGVGGGGGAHRVRADFEAQRERVTAHEFVDAVRGDGVIELAGSIVADRPEQGAFGIGGVWQPDCALISVCANSDPDRIP
jgi:hypothetical protein